MIEGSLLSVLILTPLIGAVFIAMFLSGDERTTHHNARNAALWTTIVNFLISLLVAYEFDVTAQSMQFVEKHEWFEGLGIYYYLGIDGISLCLLLLTTFLMPLCILAGWNSIKTRSRDYMVSFLVLESLVIGTFCAVDALLFYVFFEAVLIPMYIIIGVWGGANRIYAAYKFFLYTLLGSILFLVALVYLYYQFGTTDMLVLAEKAPELSGTIQHYLWFAMFASFAVKMPMWPVHTWLPDAHVQAPTAGSVILAGVLLKIGGYGFLRFSLPMLPQASVDFAPMIYALSVVAVIYTSLVALVQKDMKKLIAYSSVAHMGLVTIGLFAFNSQGIEGAMVQMVSHGLISGALFLCVGVVYDRLHTREIARYGGLVAVMPRYAMFFLFFTMASIGLPGTSGFVGEFIVIMGIFKVNALIALLASTGMVLGAAYALWLYRRVVFGALTKGELKKMEDVNTHEQLMFMVLAACVLFIGVYPSFMLDVISPPITALIEHMNASGALSTSLATNGGV
ncbi:MAG: NADH-quinone oxidoreductase subunit M [Alphaproteobacteria bacterium]|nr:MAG: NADH-quinone oxidoreductase subunit M [Alphaproteobacteria bacterium]